MTKHKPNFIRDANLRHIHSLRPKPSESARKDKSILAAGSDSETLEKPNIQRVGEHSGSNRAPETDEKHHLFVEKDGSVKCSVCAEILKNAEQRGYEKGKKEYEDLPARNRIARALWDCGWSVGRMQEISTTFEQGNLPENEESEQEGFQRGIDAVKTILKKRLDNRSGLPFHLSIEEQDAIEAARKEGKK